MLPNVARSTPRLVGRRAENDTLAEMMASERAELLALYGRRRVGKTFLIRNVVQPAAGLFIEITGTRSAAASVQRRRYLVERVVDGEALFE